MLEPETRSETKTQTIYDVSESDFRALFKNPKLRGLPTVVKDGGPFIRFVWTELKGDLRGLAPLNTR